MKYRIGEVSKILGISPETLRFFEAKGIVRPQHDPKSSYRYFDSLDVNKMVAYLNYRRMGFSLDEAVLLVSKCELSFLREELDRRNAAISAEREKLARVQARIQDLSASLNSREALRGKLEVRISPALRFFANQEDLNFRISEANVRATRQWLRELPVAFPYARIDISTREARVLWGFAKPVSEDASEAGLLEIPSARCLHGFFLVPSSDPEFSEARKIMAEWSLAHAVALSVWMHGTVLHEFEQEGEIQWLFEFYAPILEK